MATPGLGLHDGTWRVDDASRAVVIRVPEGSRDTTVVTPDAHIAMVWAVKHGRDWLVATDEAALLGELARASGVSVDECVDLSAMAVRMELGQSIFMTSIVAGAAALPPAVSVELDNRTLDFVLDSAVQNISPVESGGAALLDGILEYYRQQINDVEEIPVFVSGGWDSRIEVAALNEVRGSRRLHLLHFYSSDAEVAIAEALADRVDGSLTVFDPRTALDVGLAWFPMRSRLSHLATWRPTIPAYGTVAASASRATGSRVFGYASFNLKGKFYGEVLSPTVPWGGQLRARHPGSKPWGAFDDQCSAVVHQQARWRTFLKLTEGWPQEARYDYLIWTVHHGYTYAHRLRELRGLVIPAPWHLRAFASQFMGLARSAKEGTAYIHDSLARLRGGLDSIPVVSSTGAGGHLTSAVSSDFKVSADSPGVITRLGRAGPDLGGFLTRNAEADSIFAAALRPQASLDAISGCGTTLSRQLLTVAEEASTSRLVNAIQLAEFLNAAHQSSESMAASAST